MATGDNVGTHGQSFFGYAGFGFEASGSYGTAVDPSTYSDIVSDGFSEDNGTMYLNTIRSRGRHHGTAGPFEDSGELEMVAAPENGLGYLLNAVMGTETLTTEDPTTTGSPTVGHHEFTTSPLLPSLTVELGVGDIAAVQHVGTGVDTLELEHAAEEYLMSTFETISKEPQIQDTLDTPTFSDLRPFVYHDGTFTFNSLDRTADIQEATFSIENGLEGQYRGERSIQFINVGERVPECEATFDFTDKTLWEEFYGASAATSPQDALFEGSISSTWTSPEVIPNTGDPGVNYSLTVEYPRVRIDAREANMSENDQIAETDTFGALVDPSTGNDMVITLTNSITTTYM